MGNNDHLQTIGKAVMGLENYRKRRRFRLLVEAALFVKAVQHIDGVTRIALIGSLTTNKSLPKDVDMLVTVTDDADVALVAQLGRKLAGHAQNFGCGGEVFLANPPGEYLGRTCPWGKCPPGIHKHCEPFQCKERPRLYKDLGTLTLSKKIVAHPPIELWPRIIVRTPKIPDDVNQFLLRPLQEDLLPLVNQVQAYFQEDGVPLN